MEPAAHPMPRWRDRGARRHRGFAARPLV